MEIPESFQALIAWLGSPGAMGIAMSIIIENFAPFQRLSSTGKMLALMSVCVGLGLLSAGLTIWVPAGVVAGFEPWYKVIASSIGVFLASQFYHAGGRAAVNAVRFVAKTVTPSASSSHESTPAIKTVA